MNRLLLLGSLFVVGLGTAFLSFNAKASCVDQTPLLKQMHIAEDQLIIDVGTDTEKSVPISYRVADTQNEKAAGFQHICARSIEKQQILFVFNKPFKPNFHMRNVWGVLDIAFIDESGVIVDIQTMQPYSLLMPKKPTYAPPTEIKYALEAREGYFKSFGAEVGKSKLLSLTKETKAK